MKKIIILIIFIIVIVFILFNLKGESLQAPSPTPASSPAISSQDKPQIVSTKPNPLEEAVIFTTDIIEISFNRPLENTGEFKLRIEPKIDYKIELSNDRKTAKIIPVKPYELGSTYTLFIGSETKFDGVGRWGEEKVFHFKTIKYSGI